MSKPLISALAQFAAATAGRNMTRAAYVAVAVGVLAMVLLTVNPAYETAHRWVDALLWTCLIYFVFEWVVRLRHMARQGRLALYMSSSAGLVDAVSVGRPAAPIPGDRAQDGVAAQRALGAEGGAGHSRPAAAPPRAGARIGTAGQRARDLPDGGLPGLGRGIFPGAGRAAADVRQHAGRAVVGRRDADDDGLWRRRAGDAAGPRWWPRW